MFRPGNLDEQVRPPRFSVKRLRLCNAARRVVGELRRNFERYPAIDAIGRLMNRKKQVSGASEILEHQIKQHRFSGPAASDELPYRFVVSVAVRDGMIEDRRVGCESGDREFVDVALERPAVEQVTGDGVEPESLADIVQLSCRVHDGPPRLRPQ